jgi:hypothetical protein
MVRQPTAECLEVSRIDLIKRSRRVRIHIEHGAHLAGWVEHRHNNFRAGRARAGDVMGHLSDVGDDLCLRLTGALAADAPFERNRQAAVSALVRTDLEEPGRNHPVKAGPVEVIEAVVELADDRGHHGDLVGLTFEERAKAIEDELILTGLVHRLVHSRALSPGSARGVPRT